MSFKDKIEQCENINLDSNIYEKEGSIPVIITAPHTMKQVRSDGTVKMNEPYTKAIAIYVGNEVGAYNLIKLKDTGIDANSLIEEEFKTNLIDIINKNDIKLFN